MRRWYSSFGATGLMVLVSACSPVISVGTDADQKSFQVVSRSCGDAPPYVRTRAEGQATSHCLRWPKRSLIYRPETGHTPDEAAAIAGAFASWQTVARDCSDLNFSEGPPSATPPVANDGENVVVLRRKLCVDVVDTADACWTETNCANKYNCWDHSSATTTIGLTTVSYLTSTGEIMDADIEVNTVSFTVTTVDGPACPEQAPASTCVAVDLRSALTHEIGHFLGLAHVVEVTAPSTMAAAQPFGSTVLRAVDLSSACFVCDVYKTGQKAADCI